ncbi:Hypothetical predicted protein [Octopus vulgaris]|uniref:Uncharacterized protein n=1 Tax=Octopus vulgaris TaxID=6645 RepID=A0AA36AT35_OCTVU|nr:Hypothetical predicted protein [Octopus vulgaris]
MKQEIIKMMMICNLNISGTRAAPLILLRFSKRLKGKVMQIEAVETLQLSRFDGPGLILQKSYAEVARPIDCKPALLPH